MTTTEPIVDRQHAQRMLDGVSTELIEIQGEHLASPDMVDYHYNRLVTLEVYHQLWSDVLRNGWDQATSRMGVYIRGVTTGLSTSTPRRLLELQAALRWWHINRRRAMQEGLDMEHLVMAL